MDKENPMQIFDKEDLMQILIIIGVICVLLGAFAFTFSIWFNNETKEQKQEFCQNTTCNNLSADLLSETPVYGNGLSGWYSYNISTPVPVPAITPTR